jgi:hypothetical protein
MKVYISNYPHFIRTYKWFDKYENKLSEKTIDILSDTTQFIVNWCWNYPLRKDSERRVYVKIDGSDTWSADHTLAFIIHPLLLKLKEKKQGSPFVVDEDVPEELKSTSAPPKEKDYDVDENHHKRWEWVLDEMIWAFGQMLEDWEEQFHSGKIDMQFKKLEDSENFEMIEGPKDTHKFDKDGYDKHWDRMQNGYRLFGKYYSSLWT